MITPDFDSSARYYNEYRPEYPHEFYQALSDLDPKLRNAEYIKAGRLLDIGTGTGKIVLTLSSAFNEAVGIDISEAMLYEAEKQYSKIKHVKKIPPL